MRVIVCVKQIADAGMSPEPALGTTWSVRTDDPLLDDTDRYGIELGLQLAAADGGTVTLLSLGSAANDQGIRQGLAMDAEKAIFITDNAERGSDALTTARALSAVIAEEEPDLVITGTASTDGSAGVMCQMLGELLGFPAVSDVTAVDVGGGRLTLRRQTAGGYDMLDCGLPAVISATAGAVEPRYPTFKGVMNSKRKPVQRRALRELTVEPPGGAESAQTVVALVPAPTRKAGTKIEDNGEAHLAVIALLEDLGVI